MKKSGFGLLILALALLAVPLLGDEDKGKAGGSVASLAGARPVDEYNDTVKDKLKGDGNPVPGGEIRIRIPIEPKSLNRIIENGAQATTVATLILEPLIFRDPETFEFHPRLARSWEQRDVLMIKGEAEGQEPTALEGLLVKDGKEEIEFAVGGSLVTLAVHDLQRLDMAAGLAVTKDRVSLKSNGRTWSGKLLASEPVVKLEVDMAWNPKEIKEFKPEDVEVLPAQSYSGAIGYGLPGNDKSVTVQVRVLGADVRKIPVSKVAVDEIKSGGKTRQELALKQQVVMLFHIRRGVRWHDGEKVDVDDIVFSLNTIQNSYVDCAPMRNYYADIKSCSKIGPDSVRFEYATQYFRALTFCGEIPVFPRHRFQPEKFKGDDEGFGKHFNNHPDNFKPIGCGPYKFSRWEKGLFIEVVRNDDYYTRYAGLPFYHPERPYLDKIRWVVVNDKNAAVKQLVKGEIDADFDIEPLTWRDEETQSPEFTKDLVRAKFLQPLYTYIGWNQNNPNRPKDGQLFSDRNVRMAMSMLIDRRAILEEIHGSLGEMVSGPFYRYGPFVSERVEPVPYNPERAKVLLDRAGWIDHDGDGIRDKDGVKFEFEYLIHNARAYHQKIADKVKESVEQAGVLMNIKKIDWRVFQDAVSDHNFDAVRFAWGEPSCIETDPYQIWHSSQSEKRGSNYISFNNPQTDEIIEKVRREMDFGKRQRLLKRFHEILAAEQPYTFMFNFYSLYFYNKRYRNVKFYIIGTDPYDLSEWYVPKDLQGKK